MSFSGQVYPQDAIGYFRIASASGRQPIEPVSVGEFRIGSGPACQLRLGDAAVPDIHTVLSVDRNQTFLTCSVEQPQLLVNGTAVRSCQLEDGDLVEIGNHRLLFRRVAAEQSISLDETAFEDSATDAEAIVDRLDEQLQLIDQLADSPDSRVIELLRAVAEESQTQQRQDQAKEESGPTELQQVIDLLQRHHEASRIRLESLTEVLNNVVRQQKLIADTLEVMSGRIQKLDTDTGYSQRKSA